MMTGKVSIIVPCYNEAETIVASIQQVQSLRDVLEIEVVVVDDGSTDETAEKLKDVTGILVESHERNKGKGAAIATGAAKASGEVIVIQDADLEYDPTNIPQLVNPILEGRSDVIFGSRFMGKIVGMRRSHYIANKVLSFFTSVLYGAKVTDMMTGHKAFRASVFRKLQLESKGFEFELEVTIKVLQAGYAIEEIPIVYNRRQFGQAKIRWTDGVRCLIQIFAYRLGL